MIRNLIEMECDVCETRYQFESSKNPEGWTRVNTLVNHNDDDVPYESSPSVDVCPKCLPKTLRDALKKVDTDE